MEKFWHSRRSSFLIYCQRRLKWICNLRKNITSCRIGFQVHKENMSSMPSFDFILKKMFLWSFTSFNNMNTLDSTGEEIINANSKRFISNCENQREAINCNWNFHFMKGVELMEAPQMRFSCSAMMFLHISQRQDELPFVASQSSVVCKWAALQLLSRLKEAKGFRRKL